MSKITIDITKYDRPHMVSYFFTEEEFRNPKETFKKFSKDKSPFLKEDIKKKYEIKLTLKQDTELLEYLKGEYFRNDEGDANQADFAIAFSYGVNSDVNLELAFKTIDLITENPNIKVYAQWEIFNEVRRQRGTMDHNITSLGFDYDKDYVTTDDLIDKFIESEREEIKIIVIAQAWHSVRCIETCKNKKLIIEGQRVVDDFSASDPQKWVRNAFAWVLKEATKPEK